LTANTYVPSCNLLSPPITQPLSRSLNGTYSRADRDKRVPVQVRHKQYGKHVHKVYLSASRREITFNPIQKIGREVV